MHVRCELLLGVRHAAQDRVSVRKQDLAGLGEPRALAIAFDQRRPGFALQRRDLLADRRLRVGERLGRGRERASIGELTEDDEPSGIQHKRSLSIE